MAAKRARFEPVHQETTAALIAGQLREAIMYGRLAPGHQLSEAELAGQFGVSRGPLREAMQRLVQEGLLRSERNRGIFVTELDADDIRDIYVARAAIECTAATLLVRSGDPEAIEEVREAGKRMEKAAAQEGTARLSDADLHFHEALVSQSGSPRLHRMHETLLVETRMCLTELEKTYSNPEDSVAEHTAIIDAIEAGDEELTLKRVEEHMEQGLRRLVP